MKLEIPEEVLDALRLPPGEVEHELRKELALALYARGVLSAGKAHELAGLGRWQFDELLGIRRMTRHYSEENLEEDLACARGSQGDR
jgi:predicted HTH domain antitoxin